MLPVFRGEASFRERKDVQVGRRRIVRLHQPAVFLEGDARNAVKSLSSLETLHDIPKGKDSFAHHNEIDGGSGEILGHDRGVMAADHSEDLWIPGLDRVKEAPDRVHVHRVGRDAHDIGGELLQYLGQGIFEPQIEDLDVVILHHACGYVFQGQGFIDGKVFAAQGDRRFGRLNE